VSTRTTLRTLPADQAADILARLDRGEGLSNVDFSRMGHGMETFLRYAQMSSPATAKFHDALRPHLKKRANA